METSHVSFFILVIIAALGCIGVLALVIYTLRLSARRSIWQSIKKIRTQCPVCQERRFAVSRYCANCGARAKNQEATIP